MPSILPESIIVESPIVDGSGRGKDLAIPTMNLSLKRVPNELARGIYAAKVFLQPQNPEKWSMAAVHYGPRPVFRDSESFEVHVLDEDVNFPPDIVRVELIAKLRDVQNFPNAAALVAAINHDIEQARAILAVP